MKNLRKLYDWVLCWAEKTSGPKVLAEISFSEASFFPILPFVLLIPTDKKSFKLDSNKINLNFNFLYLE